MGRFDGFPLHKAAEDEKLSDEATVAKLEPLLSQRLNINETAGEYKWTALMLAAWQRKTAAVQLLLRHGADPNIQNVGGASALHSAVDRGDAAIVVALLHHGADPAVVDRGGRTARDLAVDYGHGELARLLEEGTKALKEWLDAVEGENEEKANKLLEEMPKNNAFYYALISNREEKVILAAVDRLLEAGVNTRFKFSVKGVLDKKYARGKTILDLALETERTKMAEVILSNTISSGEPLLDIMRRSDISKTKENLHEIWTSVMTSDDSKKRIKKALEEKQLDDLNVIFNDIDVEVQGKLFLEDKIHQERNDGKTLLQHLAERGDEISRQREDFVSMLARIDKHIYTYPDEHNFIIYKDRDGAAGRVVAQLKESLESSQHLVTWIETAKRQFPISKTKMRLQILVAFLFMVYRLGTYLGDVGTDGWVTHNLYNFSTLPDSAFSPVNMTVLKLEAIEQCKNYSQQLEFVNCFEENYQANHINHRLEENQFSSEEWNMLFILSLVHMVLPWPLFWFVAIYLIKPKTCSAVLEVLFFPVSTYFQQFFRNISLSRVLHEQEIEGEIKFNEIIKEYKEEITENLKKLEEKETLVATIEVSSESSFQFYIQTLIALPHVFISTVGAFKSKNSFKKEIVSWQNISILFSFLAMAKTFHRIRNLSKQNALSGKAAILNFLLTTFETIARILCFGLFLYLYSQNLDAVVAVGVYYGHVFIMIVFNLVFNKEKPSRSVAYLLGLLLNALNSVFTYNNYQYEKILGKKKSEKELHQPSLARQVAFYSVFLMENLALIISSWVFFNEKEQEGSVHIADGFGGKFQMSRANFESVVGFVWGCQGASILMRILYYSVHPSDVSVTDLNAKNQISIFGNKYEFASCQKKQTGCCVCYVCCGLKDNGGDGQTGLATTKEDVEAGNSDGADRQLEGKEGVQLEMEELTTEKEDAAGGNLNGEPEGKEGAQLEKEELTTEKEDAGRGTFNRADGEEGEEEKETSFTEEGSRDEDESEDLQTKDIATSETPLLGKSASQT